MAYSPEKKRAVRSSFVYERLPLPEAAQKHSVSYSAAQAWKRQAKAHGDDWDRARAGARIIDTGATAEILEQFCLLFDSTLSGLKAAEIDPLAKAEALSRLADAYTKTVKAAGLADKSISKLAVAMEVLQELAEFIKTQFPDDIGRFAAILEAIEPRVSEVFG